MEVIGHEEVFERFAEDIPNNIVLLGIRGIGKQRVAVTLAEKYAKPYDTMRLDTDMIGIDAIREVTQFISKRPFGSKYKIVIINTDTMTDNAAQALLTMLEEPPERVRFILTNSNNRIPLTILSRCTQVRLKPLSSMEATDALRLLGFNPEIAFKGGKFAKGSVANALNYLNKEQDRQSVLSVIQLISNRKIEAVITATRKWTDVEIDILLTWFEDYLQAPYGTMSMFTAKELSIGSMLTGNIEKYINLLKIPMKPSIKVLYLAVKVMEG